MRVKVYTILSTTEYDEWLETETAKSQVQIHGRISRIREDGYFGDHKTVDDRVRELRWKCGRRVYYAHFPEKKILLLLGGNKNGQSKDIHQAKKILQENITFEI